MISPKKSIINAKGYDIPAFLDDCLMKLDSNENNLGPSPAVIEAIKSICVEEIKFYPAYGELIDVISKLNNVENGMVLPTNGADEAINYIFDAFIENEDTVLSVTPSFAMPKVYAKSAGCVYKEITYSKKWVFPIEEFLVNIEQNPKLVIVTTPNNPTGEAISRENLIKILDKSTNSLVMIDETYSNYSDESFVDFVKQYPNAIIVRSLSKDYGLAGLRLGYIIASKEIIEIIKRIISPYSVNSVAVKAGIAAIKDVSYLEYIKKEIKESKSILIEGLKDFAQKIYKSNSSFILADFGNKAEFIYKKLLNKGIKVKSFFGVPELETSLRITAPSVENAKIFLDCLKKRDLIAFDMDGVIVDTTNSYRLAIKGTYESFAGKSLTPEEIQSAKNQGGLNNDWDLTYYLLEKAGIYVSSKDMIDKFQELYYGNGGTGFILNENILIKPETLKKLAESYDLAIFTGRPKEEALFFLRKWGIEDLFSPIITMDDVPSGCHKPDPWGLNYILDVVKPNKVFYLGDTPDDMIAARLAGVNGIGVLPPQDKSEFLKNRLIAEKAVAVLENTEDIVKYIGAEEYAQK